MRRFWMILLAVAGGLTLAVGQAGAVQVPVNSDIVVDTTWTTGNEYILEQVIYVTSGATLTIEPGVVVRGEPESAPGANDPGTLVITRDSKIMAAGTEAQPIVFTDLFDDNVPGSTATPPYDTLQNSFGLTEQWGGLILLGRSYIANNTTTGPDPTVENQIEGLAADPRGRYGGCASDVTPPLCDDDDSGVLRFVSIRYGGFNLSPNNEINGLTLGAVGRSTKIDHIEIFQNKDDGMEFFGGTAQLKNVVIYAPGDDGIDYDEGFRGKLQYIFLVQGALGAIDKSDKGGEWDGGVNDPSQPYAEPTLYNITMVGHGPKGGLANTAMHIRDNAGGRIYNSAFLDFGGSTMCVEGPPATAATSCERSVTPYSGVSCPAGSPGCADGTCSVSGGSCLFDADCPLGETCEGFYLGPDSAFQLEHQDNTFWCFGGGSTLPLTGAEAATAGCDNKDHCDPGIFTNATLQNDYFDCFAPLPITELKRRDSGSATVPDPIELIDPRPVFGSPLEVTDRVAPPEDGFFTEAPFRGAFGSQSNWARNWTNLDAQGAFPPPPPSAVPQVPVNADIVTDTTWTSNNEYILQQVIYVTNGATLTIEPGTVIRGEPESSPGANDPGALVISRDSKLFANGTSDKPIVFTDLFDDNVRDSNGTPPYDTKENAAGLTEQWGGLILLGRSYVANNTTTGPDPTVENQIEGLAADPRGRYGGCASDVTPPLCDDDDSGSLSFVSIRYGGFNLSANNEINGLTLGAVGRSTHIDHVEIFQNKDDGIEFFGGTAQIKNIIIALQGDDGLDWDEGFRGKVQFVFEVQGKLGALDRSDKGSENDGGVNDPSQPYAIPTVYNVTYVGRGAQDAEGPDSANTGLHMRDNTGGRYFNSFFADFGGATMCLEGAGAASAGTTAERSETEYSDATRGGGATGATNSCPATGCQDGVCSVTGGNCSITADCPDAADVCEGFYLGPDPDTRQLQIDENEFYCFGQGDVLPILGADAAAVGCDNTDHYDPGIFTTFNNNYRPCTDPLPIRTLQRVADTGTDPVSLIDPRPATGGVLTVPGRPTPVNDGFFTDAPYKGAFAPDSTPGAGLTGNSQANSNWAACWSTLSRLGFFPGHSSPFAATPEVLNVRFASKSTMTWDPVPGGSVVYDVLRSEDPTDFVLSATCIESDDFGNTDAFTLDPGSAGQVYFYVVRAETVCGVAGPLHFSYDAPSGASTQVFGSSCP